MKQVSSHFKEAIRKPKQIDSIITFGDTILDISEINSIRPYFFSRLFKTIMKCMEIDTNVEIAKGTSINVQFGVWVNGTFEYIDYGDYVVYSIEKLEDTSSYRILAYDKIVESMTDYDLSIEYPITIRNYLIAIYEKLNWDSTGIPDTFTNYDKLLSQDVHSGINYTYRDVLDEICTVCGVFLINKNGIPTICKPNDTLEVIDESYLNQNNVKVIQKVFFNSLVFSRIESTDDIYRKDDDNIVENGLREFKILNNQILSTTDRDQFVDSLWEYLKNFQYYSFEVESEGIFFLEPADLFTFSINGNNYPTLLLNDDTTITQGTYELLYSETPKETITEYKYASENDKQQNQILFLVDKQNKTIQAVVETQNGQSSTLDKLIKTTNNPNYIEAKNAFESYPVQFSFYGDMHYTWLRDTTYLGEETYLYDSYLVIEYENDIQKIKLPYFDLNYTDDLYDEFRIENTRAYIIRRLDNELHPLDEEIIEELGNISILLKNGYNKLYMEDFDLNYSLKYNVQSTLTDTLATKAELKITEEAITNEVSKKADDKEIRTLVEQKITDSETSINSNINKKLNDTTSEMNNIIEQKVTDVENSINMELKNYVSNDEYTSAKIFAKINSDTSSAGIDADKIILSANDILNLLAGNTINLKSRDIVIESDNCSIDAKGNAKLKNGEFEGKLTSNEGDIGGWTINNNGLTNGTVFLNSDGSSTIYTVADLIIIRGYIMGRTDFELPPQMIKHYDLNDDGVVNAVDYAILQNLIGISMN